ncbi:MAG TPA: HAD family hydrolase [Actinocrinis sp.]|nr:HAD family hydrolase [Actinocrinis sp.]
MTSATSPSAADSAAGVSDHAHIFSLPTTAHTAAVDLLAPPPPIEAVLFDFANTLFRMVPTEVFLGRVWQEAGRDRSTLDAARVAGQIRAAGLLPHVLAAQAGRDSSLDAHREATRIWFGEVPALAGVFEYAYTEILSQRSWFPYEDTAPVLRELAARSVPVGVVSDIVWDLRRDFAAYGLADTVQAYSLSFELGCEKPDPRMFATACEALGVDPRRTLMVGDNPPRDGGATAGGLRAFLLPSEPKTGVRGLASVLSLLG